MDTTRIIAILADGKFHSGEALGSALGVSRAAVWKQISQLQELGLTVHSVKGRGYRLAQGIELLAPQQIGVLLDPAAARLFPAVVVRSIVGSTNDELKAGNFAAPAVVLAEMQQAGKGRRGKRWISPYGANLYMSVNWEFPEASRALDGLSLCAGIAVAEAIAQQGVAGVGLKWPNDLLYQDQKVAGILLELEGEVSGPMRVIIGIGVNVAMSREAGAEIDQCWTSLTELSGKRVSRNQLAAQILTELANCLPKFQQQGFSAFTERWRHLDLLLGREVEINLSAGTVVGQARGVTGQGELLVATGDGIKSYRGGEVSIRVAQ